MVFSIFKLTKQQQEVTMTKNKKLKKRIAENMARLGGSYEFWERRLTHGWDALEAKLIELHAQGLTDEQIFEMGVNNGIF